MKSPNPGQLQSATQIYPNEAGGKSEYSTGGIARLGAGIDGFLPVSSSGHLVVFQNWLHEEHTPVVFDLVLHIGTLLPIVWVYRDTLIELIKGVVSKPLAPENRLALWIVLGSVPGDDWTRV